MGKQHGVSLELVGRLGLASKQAAHQSGNPLLWLEGRVRRYLVSPRHHRFSSWGILSEARRRKDDYLRELASTLSSRRGRGVVPSSFSGKEEKGKEEEKRIGRPRKNNLLSLQEFLGVKAAPHRKPNSSSGDQIEQEEYISQVVYIFSLYLDKCITLMKKVGEKQWYKPYWRIKSILDRVLPRWVRKGGTDLPQLRRGRQFLLE